MLAAVLESYGDELTVYDDVECGEPGPGQVRVRVLSCGVCHSDLHMGGGFTPAPLIPGHEAAGEIDATGPGVTGVVAGDRVIVTPMPSCGRCRACLRGHPSLCDDARPWVSGLLPDGRAPFTWRGQHVRRGNGVGAFAELVLVSANAVVKIPDDLPTGLACLLSCAVQTGVGAVLNTAKVEPGSSVLVMGLGGVGQAIVQGARIAGATTIIASDPVADRREMARGFGATDVVDPLVEDVVAVARERCGGVDYAFDAAGSPALAKTGFKATGLGGTVVLVGAPRSDAMLDGIPQGLVVGQEKRILGSMMGTGNPGRDVPMLIGLWRNGALDLEGMVTAHRPLAELREALTDLEAGTGLRTVIDIGPAGATA
jgi:Zn-dependent alcohol dehydrogenase